MAKKLTYNLTNYFLILEKSVATFILRNNNIGEVVN